MNKYQLDYAANRPQMYELESRTTKAIRIVRLLKKYYKNCKISSLKVLDVGASTGIIDHELSKHFGHVTGIDIDKKAINHAKSTFKSKNLIFKVDDAMKLGLKDKSFDVVICSQVYEHVPNPEELMAEIYRVLKPNGVCYFAALNKLFPLEPHYNLLFLSWMPKKIGNTYVKIFGKASKYHETLKTYWELKKLTKKFKIVDYTSKILKNPKEYGFDNLSKFPVNLIALLIASLTKIVAPTFFWVLIKEN